MWYFTICPTVVVVVVVVVVKEEEEEDKVVVVVAVVVLVMEFKNTGFDSGTCNVNNNKKIWLY